MMEALILADFIAENPEEITVYKDSIVCVHSFGDDGWAEITFNETFGICPNEFLNVIDNPNINDNIKSTNNHRPLPTPNSNRPLPKPKTKPLNSVNKQNRPLPTPNSRRPLPTPNCNRPLPKPTIRGNIRGRGQRGVRGMRGNRGRGGQNCVNNNNKVIKQPLYNTINNEKQENNYIQDNKIQENENNEQLLEYNSNNDSNNTNIINDTNAINDTNNNDIEAKLQHRRKIVTEILETEKDYVNDIEIVANVYIVPLLEKNIISREDHSLLFSNLEVLVSVNQQLLSKLTQETNLDKIMIGLIFLEMADFFKLYTAYCANQPKSIATLDRLQKDSIFEQYAYNSMQLPECRGLTLFSFLIKPIQRICKYPLLLKDLLKNTDPSHPDYNNLEKSLIKIEDVVAYVNDRKRLAENLQKILDVQNQIESTEELNLVEPSRRFMREGTIKMYEKGKLRERNTFVFNDLIVITKSRTNIRGNAVKDHFIAQFYLTNVQLIDVADTDELQNVCEVLPKNKSEKYRFIFVFNSSEEKVEWVKEIKTLVREFQLRALKAAKQAKEKQEQDIANGIQITTPELPKQVKETKSKAIKRISSANKRLNRSISLKSSSHKDHSSHKDNSSHEKLNSGMYLRPAPPKGHQLIRPSSPQRSPKLTAKESSSSKMFKTISHKLRSDSTKN